MLASVSGGLCFASSYTSPSPRKQNSFHLRRSIGRRFSYPGQFYRKSPMRILIGLKFKSEEREERVNIRSLGTNNSDFLMITVFLSPSTLCTFQKWLRGETCKSCSSDLKWCLRRRSGFLGASAIYQRNDLFKWAFCVRRMVPPPHPPDLPVSLELNFFLDIYLLGIYYYSLQLL